MQKIMDDLTIIQTLLKTPEAFQDFIDEIPTGIIILDKNQRIATMNRAMSALTGYSNNKTAGIKCRDILRAKICIENCQAARQFREPGVRTCETDIINLDRQKIPVRITSAALRNGNGDIKGFIETVEDLRHIKKLETTKKTGYSFASIVGKSHEMEKIFNILPILAQSDSSILITGETGTGKDLIAEAIHQASPRANGAFIKVNCGALPETLLESELFGHQKGAFTGAVENKPGRFRLAHNGTLFLTEIGDLPLSLQVKLLTFLDDKIVYPLGSSKGFHANVRVVAATHRNLEQMVKDGNFRKDLLFRLNVARVHLPSLWERKGDIRILLEHFRQYFNSETRKNIKGFSKQALIILLAHKYSGNIRELRNIIEYSVNICQGSEIETGHLPVYLTDLKNHTFNNTADENQQEEDNIQTSDKESSAESQNSWKSAEKRMIFETLLKANGRKAKAAEMLGWSRSTLWRKMNKHSIEE